MSNMQIPKIIPVPDGKSYLPYQEEGIQYALEKGSVLIGDEPGLGKTVEAIGIINANPDIRKVLIVCPNSLKLNWWNEIDAWLVDRIDCEPELRAVTISVVTYEGLVKIPTAPVDLLIVDEAHFCKNPKAIRTKHVKRLAKKAERVILLTGTAIENKIIELWSLLQIVAPTIWDPAGYAKVDKKKVKVGPGEGAGFFKFAVRYCNGHKEFRGRKAFWDFSGSSNLEELQEKLRATCMIRRMKSDVLSQLPDKRHQVVVLPSGSGDKCSLESYKEFESDLEHDYEAAIAKLHANKIAFAEFSTKRHEQGLDKVEAVIEHVKLSLEETDKIILFAQHTDVIMELVETLNFYGCVFMTGETPVVQRQDAVDVFQQDPNCKIIIGSIGTMGVGWTLTAASLVQFVEIDPVPGRMAQAADRAHRIGQKNSVLVQYLVKNGSIDARMCQILVKKMKVVSAALNPVQKLIPPIQDVYVNGKLAGQAGSLRRDINGNLENWTDEEIKREITPWSEPSASSLGMVCRHPNSAIVAFGSRYKCTQCNTELR